MKANKKKPTNKLSKIGANDFDDDDIVIEVDPSKVRSGFVIPKKALTIPPDKLAEFAKKKEIETEAKLASIEKVEQIRRDFKEKQERQRREEQEAYRKANEAKAAKENRFIEVDFDEPENTKFPMYIKEVGRKVFIDVLNMYKANDIVNKLDVSILVMYAKTVEEYHDYEYRFATGEYQYIEAKMNGNSESVESKMFTRVKNDMKNLSSLLLINPKSRNETLKSNEGKAKLSPLEKFLQSKNQANL